MVYLVWFRSAIIVPLEPAPRPPHIVLRDIKPNTKKHLDFDEIFYVRDNSLSLSRQIIEDPSSGV